MSSATGSGCVAGEAAGGAAELVVERDCGCEGREAGGQAHAEVSQGACSVALESKNVLAGPEDRLDPLADRREVWPATGLRRPCS